MSYNYKEIEKNSKKQTLREQNLSKRAKTPFFVKSGEKMAK